MRRMWTVSVVCVLMSATATAALAHPAPSSWGPKPAPRHGRSRVVGDRAVTPRVRRGKATASSPNLLAKTAAVAASDPVLFGDQTIETGHDYNVAGTAEAFAFTNTTTGTTGSIAVYVDSSNGAKKLYAGLYTNNNGHPGSLVVSGALSTVASGAWNSVPVPSVAISSGRTYWLAVLGTGGSLQFRDRTGGPCVSENSAQSGLSSLAATWKTGPQYGTCPISAYVNGYLAATSPPATPVAPSNTALPAISGTATQGHTLSTSNGTWNGSASGYSYQWRQCDSSGNSCTNISGATASSYTLATGDVGHTVRAAVTATNAGGSATATSNATTAVAVLPPTAAFTYSPASPVTGHVVHFDASASKCFASPCTYSWADVPPSGGTWPFGTGQTIDFTFEDAATKHVTLTVTDAANQTATIEHDVVVAAGGTAAPSNTSLPTISGTPQQGSTLTESDGTWTGNPTSYSYRWMVCDGTGANCSAANGETAKTYVLDAGDVGHTLRGVATATNAGGSTSATSAPTAVITAATTSPPSPPSNSALPAISGTATQGQSLSTSNGTWNGTPTSYSYQWRRCDSSGNSCTDVSGATASSYTLASGDVGHTIRASVTATNAGGSAAATSGASAVVVASSGQQTNCVSRPSACGYPDATNSGVPAGTQLTPKSGNITANVAGQTISNIDLTNGTIVVTANNVTIKNSRITTGNGQLNGTSAVDIKPGVTGTLVEDTTMQGSNCSTGSLFAGVMNESGDQQTLLRDYATCIDDILHGSGTIKDSYSIDNANIPNDHYEPVAYDGGDGSITIVHNTLLNPHDQTAAVFVTCYFGPVTTQTIDNNLMAGGDYVIYGPEGNGACNSQTGHQEVMGNRFSKVYFPAGGQYGIDAYFQSNNTTWSGNYWDENLAAASM
jgi:hypothetical protein